MARRRIQPKPSVELATVTLRLPVQLVRAVDHYAKYLGGSTDRTYVMAQAIEIDRRKKLEQDLQALAEREDQERRGERHQRDDPRVMDHGLTISGD